MVLVCPVIALEPGLELSSIVASKESTPESLLILTLEWSSISSLRSMVEKTSCVGGMYAVNLPVLYH